MAIARKAFVWLLFAAGGTVTALVFPVLIALFALVATGHVPPGLGYGPMREFAGSLAGGAVLFGIVALSVWHAAHRARVLAHDLGIRADRAIARVVYFLAGAATVAAALLLTSIGTGAT